MELGAEVRVSQPPVMGGKPADLVEGLQAVEK
jgi:hypothetical protein